MRGRHYGPSPHLGEGEQDHQRRSDGADSDLRQGHVGRLEGEEEDPEQHPEEAHDDRLAQRIAGENHRQSADCRPSPDDHRLEEGVHRIASGSSTRSARSATQWPNWRIRAARAVA